ncbi:M1 family metallopeptidase [Priestia taiwanensis]|uniref:Peptidase M1 membrane alanine aminopeptidase domain-containing protein n=1 Tax=Priestia taiwanensis TaxID=1347902 RepID=A0A917AKL5_9BACI|nr:M1 family metallopeptidase [Priestia taiwanensis]MBM7362077.1 hypothetical protein [Priestia taiwanensis]GGE59286.1 hypothetical protein GCM10007140_07000 [Priestia taiwanensis]
MKKYKLLLSISLVISIVLSGCFAKETTNEALKVKEESKKRVVSNLEGFTPQEILPGSKSEYDMKLAMNEEGKFRADAKITITNLSDETWSDLKLYVIPNVSTPIKITSLKVDGKERSYTLEQDMLHVPLQEGVALNKSVTFHMKYEFKEPISGFRFSRIGENYYLAHWYPMVPTYRNGWNKQPYANNGESYHTTFSNFKVAYDIPEEYTIVTTGENRLPSGRNGVIHAEKVKEFYVGIMKNPKVVERNIQNVKIRMLGVDESDELLQEVFGIAERALTYFSTTFGPYPHNELDIILDGPAMEYPGIVTVSSAKEVPKEFLVEAIVHEIAHQWFYGMVTNDPYFHAWIDEGMTSLATDMFLEKNLSKEHYGSFLETNGVRPSNLSLNDYEGTLIFAYIYGQVPMKINEIFDGYSGRETAEAFLKEYVRLYQYKEIDTDEFVRFIKHYLQLEDDSLFEGWLKLK